MAGLKLDMKLDNQRGLGPLVDVAVVALVAVVIVVAAGSTVTAPIVGVIALWAGYYLFGLQWAGWPTLGKRVAARAEAAGAAPVEAAAPSEDAAPPAAEASAAAPEEEPAEEMGPDLVSPALRDLIADLETAKGNAREATPTADAPSAEHEEAEPEEAEVEVLEPEQAEPAEAEPEDAEPAEAEPALEPAAHADEPASEPARPRVEAYDRDDDIDEATVEALLEDESPADATHK